MTLAATVVGEASHVSVTQKVLFAGHGWHLLEILGVFLTSIAAIWVAETVRRRPRAKLRELRRQPLLWAVAVLGAAGGAIHFTVMPEHFAESALYGTFFLLSAALQIVYAGWLLWRPTRALLVIGAAGNLSVALLWLFTRTVEIPLGPAAGTRERFGGLDVTCSILEALIAAGVLAIMLRERSVPSATPDARSWHSSGNRDFARLGH